MKEQQAIYELLKKKIERQVVLKKKAALLEEIDLDLFSSKFGRWFGTTYLVMKRVILLLLGLAITVVSFSLLVFPEMVLQDPQFRKEIIQESKNYYSEMAGQTLEEAIILLTKSNSDLTTEKLIQQMDLAFGKALEQEVFSTVRFFAVLLLILALVLLYISRLTRKMHVRNRNISQAESVSQDIISAFREVIEEEEKELVILQTFMANSLNSKR